jgi:hypothetical protein
VTAGGSAPHPFTVTYADNVAVSVSSVGDGDVQVLAPDGAELPAAFAGVDNTADGSPRTATYRVAAPGGAWDPADNGTYTLRLVAGQVSDTAANFAAAAELGTFTVSLSDAPPPGAATHTTAADFGGGTLDRTVITDEAGGEVQLAPALSDEFNRASLGAGWTSTPTGGGKASATLSGGVLRVAAAQVRSAAAFPPATGAEGRVAFAAAFQDFGLGTDVTRKAGNSWAVFTTGTTTNRLFADVNQSATRQRVDLGPRPTGMHVYRVDPVPGGYRFSIDGTPRATLTAIAIDPAARLRVVFHSDSGSAVQADWVRLTSYASGGTFTSALVDAGRAADWGAARWTASVPAGAALTVETSSGNTATPGDGTWSAWSRVENGGAIASPDGRYVRYRVTFATADGAATPVLSDLTIDWT